MGLPEKLIRCLAREPALEYLTEDINCQCLLVMHWGKRNYQLSSELCIVFLLPFLRYYIPDELGPVERVGGIREHKTTLLSLCYYLGLKVKKNLEGREEMSLRV